jgi:hypothetical protein
MKKIIFSIIAMMMSALVSNAQTAKFNPVTKVAKTGNGVEATYKDGSSKSFEETTSSEVSLEDKLAVLQGEKMAVKPSYRQVDGTMKHCVFTTMSGGLELSTEGKIHPIVRGELGYKTCHLLFGLGAEYSQADYSGTATTSEKSYSVLRVSGNASWKFLQNQTRRNYLALGGELGYGFQATDASSQRAHSDNYGLLFGAFLEGRIAINHQFGIVARGGYRVIPRNDHNDKQDLSYGGGFLTIGLNINFRQKPVRN